MTWHDMTWRRIKVVQSHGVFKRLWHKRSKVRKAVVSLNAFKRVKTRIKVIVMFDLAFGTSVYIFFIKSMLKSLVILAMWLALSGVNLFTNLTVFCFNSHHYNLSAIETGTATQKNQSYFQAFFSTNQSHSRNIKDKKKLLLILPNLAIKLCDFKVDLIRWQLNFGSCNFSLK